MRRRTFRPTFDSLGLRITPSDLTPTSGLTSSASDISDTTTVDSDDPPPTGYTSPYNLPYIFDEPHQNPLITEALNQTPNYFLN